jgi:hypothetical protein
MDIVRAEKRLPRGLPWKKALAWMMVSPVWEGVRTQEVLGCE